jgi:bZIP transcription factor
MRSHKVTGVSTVHANFGSDVNAHSNTPGPALMGGTQYLPQCRPRATPFQVCPQQAAMAHVAPTGVPAHAAQDLVFAKAQLPQPLERTAPPSNPDRGFLWTSAALQQKSTAEMLPQQHFASATPAPLPCFLDSTAHALGLLAGEVPHQARDSHYDLLVGHQGTMSTQMSTPFMSAMMVNANQLSHLSPFSVHFSDARVVGAQGQPTHTMFESLPVATEAMRTFVPADPLSNMTIPGENETIPRNLHVTSFSGDSALHSELPMGDNDFPHGDSSSISSSDDWEQVLAAVEDMKHVQVASNSSTKPGSIPDASAVARSQKLAVLVPDPTKCGARDKKREIGHMTEEEKKKMRIVRNRESAERSRMKKRNAQVGLEIRVRRLADENLVLRDTLESIQPGLSARVLAKLGKHAK